MNEDVGYEENEENKVLGQKASYYFSFGLLVVASGAVDWNVGVEIENVCQKVDTFPAINQTGNPDRSSV
jgi:hypothetical protein